MNARLLIMLLGIAAFAIPAAVPASQPAVGTAPATTQAAMAAPPDLATLLADPRAPAPLAIALPTHYTTLEWIDQDPFAL
ncbi:MAG TPA: hypothetical protein GYA10_05700 [Alphaproteobacteria bacterium]|nr:hypothetical protein [Alphaproteobacteria bacterium]